MSQVAIIIPVLNEAEVIGRVLAEVPESWRQDVIVVDGASTDGTAAIACAAGARVVTQERRGYGAACLAGFLAAGDASLLIFLDGDYSDPPAAIPDLLAPLLEGRADLVLGVRRGQVEAALPWHARLGNRLVTTLILFFQHRLLQDLPSFKAIPREVLAKLGMQEMTYGWTTELIVKALRQGYRIEEVSVPYRPRGGGCSKVSGNARASLAAAFSLLKSVIRFSLWQA